MKKQDFEKLKEALIESYKQATRNDPDLVAGFCDGVEHMANELVSAGALKLE